MTGGAELKYTDRDVREDRSLIEHVEAYLDGYSGEFEYLIDMKMRHASGLPLTVGMVRGVLNCMRHDPRVRDLPAPKPQEPGTVTSLTEVRKERDERPARRSRYRGSKPCADARAGGLHDRHDWKSEDRQDTYTCEGVFAINRGSTDSSGYWSGDVAAVTRIKVPYVAARGGKLIHQVGDPERSHFVWRGRRHEWGYYDMYLSVKTKCQYPSFLNDPYLLTEPESETMIALGDRRPCPHCAVL